jgi:hypothetical protein
MPNLAMAYQAMTSRSCWVALVSACLWRTSRMGASERRCRGGVNVQRPQRAARQGAGELPRRPDAGLWHIPILREPDAWPCRLSGDDDAIGRFVARAAVANCRCRYDRVLRRSCGRRNRARCTRRGDPPASGCGRGDIRRYPGRSHLPCRSGVSRVPRPPARQPRRPGPLGPHGFGLQRPVQYRRPFLRSAQARQLRAYRPNDRDFPQVPAGTGLRQVRGGSPRQHHLRYRHSPAGASCRSFRVTKAGPFLVPRASTP